MYIRDYLDYNCWDTGVYTIENLVTGKLYVGSTCRSFTERWSEHVKGLDNDSHCNKHLQSSWNKYGRSVFKFTILESCDIEVAVSCEQYWMNLLRPDYNKRVVASSNYGYRMSMEQRKLLKSREEFEVYKDDILVGTWTNGSLCSDELGILQSKVSGCLSGKFSHTKGYKFKYVGGEFLYKKKHQTGGRPKGYSHSEETKRKISKSQKGKTIPKEQRESISSKLRHLYDTGQKVARGYKWTEEQRLQKARSKTVGLLQILTKDGNVVDTFQSMKEMCVKYNLFSSNVHKVLSGERTTHRGYKFKRLLPEKA